MQSTEELRLSTTAEACRDLFMRTMEFYHARCGLRMSEELTKMLLLMRTATSDNLKAVLSMAISIITDTEAGSDQAVKTALEHGRLVLFAGRMQ